MPTERILEQPESPVDPSKAPPVAPQRWIPGSTPPIPGEPVSWPAEPGDCERPNTPPVEAP